MESFVVSRHTVAQWLFVQGTLVERFARITKELLNRMRLALLLAFCFRKYYFSSYKSDGPSLRLMDTLQVDQQYSCHISTATYSCECNALTGGPRILISIVYILFFYCTTLMYTLKYVSKYAHCFTRPTKAPKSY